MSRPVLDQLHINMNLAQDAHERAVKALDYANDVQARARSAWSIAGQAEFAARKVYDNAQERLAEHVAAVVAASESP